MIVMVEVIDKDGDKKWTCFVFLQLVRCFLRFFWCVFRFHGHGVESSDFWEGRKKSPDVSL